MYLFIQQSYKFKTIKTKIMHKRCPPDTLVVSFCSTSAQVYSQDSFINTVLQSFGLIHVPIRQELACPFSQIQRTVLKISEEEYSLEIIQEWYIEVHIPNGVKCIECLTCLP